MSDLTDTEYEIIQVPHSPTAESAVIGCILVRPDEIKSINLTEDDFYIEANRLVWSAIHELSVELKPIDYITVCTKLDERGQLALIGGKAAVMKYVSADYHSWNAGAYASTIRDRAKRRKVISIAQSLAKTAFDKDSDLDAGSADAVDGLVKLGRIEHGAVPIGEYVSMVFDDVDKRSQNPQDIYGIPTGFRDLDLMTDGLVKKCFYIISGEPGTGKSLFSFQICANLARDKHAGAVYELEMPGEQLVRREISAYSGIRTDAMLRGKMQDDEWPLFTNSVENIESLPIFISDATTWTTAGIRADLSRLKVMHDIEWALVDYMFLLNDLPNKSEIERTNFVSRELKSIAKSLDIVLIAIHSMNKTQYQQEESPKMGTLRGSAQIAYDADDIWFMTKDKTEPNKRWIEPAKARERDTLKRIAIVKIPGLPKFANCARPGEAVSRNNNRPIQGME